MGSGMPPAHKTAMAELQAAGLQSAALGGGGERMGAVGALGKQRRGSGRGGGFIPARREVRSFGEKAAAVSGATGEDGSCQGRLNPHSGRGGMTHGAVQRSGDATGAVELRPGRGHVRAREREGRRRLLGGAEAGAGDVARRHPLARTGGCRDGRGGPRPGRRGDRRGCSAQRTRVRGENAGSGAAPAGGGSGEGRCGERGKAEGEVAPTAGAGARRAREEKADGEARRQAREEAAFPRKESRERGNFPEKESFEISLKKQQKFENFYFEFFRAFHAIPCVQSTSIFHKLGIR